ncbi:retrovirus-related pol polyprotein from transposon TNT 1-94 [Tanacetum coccineum]
MVPSFRYFKNHAMNEFCAKKGIKREFSVAITPQQNGVAEKKNRTLIEAARTMLANSLLPIPFWAEAVNTACYVLNRGKFDGKSDEGYLLGYSTTSKAFRVYNKRTKRVEENMHIDFLEDQRNVAGSGPDWMFDLDFLTNTMNYIPVSVENQVNVDASTQEHYVAGSSEKDKEPTQEYILLPLHPHRPRISVEDIADKEEQHIQAFEEEKKRATQATSINKLNTGRPSVSASNSPLKNLKNYITSLTDKSWVEANGLEELLQFKLQKVWILVDLPSGEKGKIDTLRIEAIRLFLAFASYMRFTVYQMDVKSAFLYGTIEEEVYVHQPPGFVDPAYPNKVYKVIKALYCLHQAPRAWYETLSSFLMENGFRIEFEDCMHKRFQMRSMDELTFFLGLQVKQQPDGIFISQDKYIADILKKFDYWDSPFELEAFSDSDYGGASLDRKSTIGGCQFFGRRLISWQCKKQTIMANSTTKAKYVATANCCGQVTTQAAQIKDLKAQIKQLKKKAKPVISHHNAWIKSVSMKKRLARKKSLKTKLMQKSLYPNRGGNLPTSNNQCIKIKLMMILMMQWISWSLKDAHNEGGQLTKGQESSTEKAKSEGVNEAERKFSQLANDEEIARKTDLAEKLKKKREIKFTLRQRAKFLHDTIIAQRRFLAQQRSEAIKNKLPIRNQLRNQMMTYNEKGVKTPPEGIDLLIWGDLRIMFESKEDDELWKNQEEWKLQSWIFYENCGVHVLRLEDGTEINMLAERRYPLTKNTLERMMDLKLTTITNDDTIFDLLRFIEQQIDEFGGQDGNKEDL